jgi:hypothetical protein
MKMPAKKIKQGSDRRKLQDAVLVRMDAETYNFVVSKGRELGVSNATVVRDILMSEFEYAGDAPVVRRKRGSNRKPSPEILRGMEFIAAINRVGNNFNQAVKDINTARKMGDIDPHLYRILMTKLDKLQIAMTGVKNAMLGDLGLDDEDDAA